MALQDKQSINGLMKYIEPDATVRTIDVISSGFMNNSYRVHVQHKTQEDTAYIVKVYSGNNTERASKEHNILSFLQSIDDIPTPEVTFFDLDATVFHSPVLITRMIDGKTILAHPPTPEWEEKAPIIAQTLAGIHSITCPDDLQLILPDATQFHTKFLNDGLCPDYLQAYPDGKRIWQLIHDTIGTIAVVSPVCVHGDYWSGNFLWDTGGQLAAVLDWELACYGDASFDIAYCMMEMKISGMYQAADTFLSTYSSHSKYPVRNLAFCELAIATIPMKQGAPYLNDPIIGKRYRAFVQDAIDRL